MRACGIVQRAEHSPAPPLRFVEGNPYAASNVQHWAHDPSGRVFVSPPTSAISSPVPHRALLWSPELLTRNDHGHCSEHGREPFLFLSPKAGDGESSFTAGRRAVLLGTADRINDSATSFTFVDSKPTSDKGPKEEQEKGEEKEEEEEWLCGSSHRTSRVSSATHCESVSHRMKSSAATPQQRDDKSNGNCISSGESPDYKTLLRAVGTLQDVVAQLSSEIRELRLSVDTVLGHCKHPKATECHIGSDAGHNCGHSADHTNRSGSDRMEPRGSQLLAPLPESNEIIEAVGDGMRELDALPSFLPPGCRAVIDAARRRGGAS